MRIAAHPRTRMVLRITEKSFAARQAQDSALAEVEDRVTRAFAARQKKKVKNDLRPRLLALVTLYIVKAAIAVWARRQRQEMSVHHRAGFADPRPGAFLVASPKSIPPLQERHLSVCERRAGEYDISFAAQPV